MLPGLFSPSSGREMATLREIQQRLHSLNRRLAVWENIIQYLEQNFLPQDGEAAKLVLRSPACPAEFERVLEEDIEEAIKSIIEGPLSELREEIQQREGREVVFKPGDN